MKTKGIIALDGLSPRECFALADKLHGHVLGFKANSLLDGNRSAQEVTARLKEHGIVFIDIKTHDIPATVAERVKHHVWHGADLITVHASGGVNMIRKAVETYEKNRHNGMGILAVTVLTSLNDDECRAMYGDSAERVVERFAGFAEKAGAYGIVCSPKELVALRGKFPQLKRVTPGVRSHGTDTHDQARIDTPGNAIANGADFLVIGRQVTRAVDPVVAVAALDEEITKVESERN